MSFNALESILRVQFVDTYTYICIVLPLARLITALIIIIRILSAAISTSILPWAISLDIDHRSSTNQLPPQFISYTIILISFHELSCFSWIC
jgi:hypothetical protein